MTLVFNRTLDFRYGRVDVLSPRVRRVIARNPGPFTFQGTGTYIVGHGRVAVIDPGPALPEHVDALLAAVRGEQVTHIMITHTHRDHSPAAAALKDATGARTFGYGPHGGGQADYQVEEGGDYDFVPDVRMVDGDRVQGPDWTLEALHTPGHTSNHLCFAMPEEHALFSGDHVMGWSTTVISPPDGNMGAYMRSLDGLRVRDDRVYYPTHGAPIAEPAGFLDGYIAHRRDREAQVLACLGEGPMTVRAIVPRLYRDIDPRLHGAAGRTVLAHLEYLIERGEVTRHGAPGGARFEKVRLTGAGRPAGTGGAG